ncbi:hypothetical protein ES704_03471 [subsurface metagenome]|jgi:Tfp pilus assembly protein PilX
MRKRKSRNKKPKNLLLNQKGMALLTTLIFVFVLVTLAVALLTMTNNDSRMSTLQRESNKAFYLADAGIEDAFWKLNTDVEDGGEDIDEWRPTNKPDPGTATEYYQVTIVDDGVDADGDRKIKITSTGSVIGGKYSSGNREIEVMAEIDYVIKTMYDYAILAEKIILFQGDPGPDVVGDVHSNDDILVSPADGDFVENYPGTATCSGDTNDLNSDNTGVTGPDLPFVDYPKLKARALADEASSGVVHYHTGNVILGVGDPPMDWTGIHYIEGNLEAKNGSIINVTNGAIIATGDVDVKEGAIFNITNDPETYIDPTDPITAFALVAQGDIKIYAKAEIAEGVVQSVLADGLTTEGFIELKNGCEVTGSVIADTVYLRNKSIVDYGTGLSEFTTKGDPFFKKTSWREAY